MKPCTCTYGLPPMKRDCPRHGHLIRNVEDEPLRTVAKPLSANTEALEKIAWSTAADVMNRYHYGQRGDDIVQPILAALKQVALKEEK